MKLRIVAIILSIAMFAGLFSTTAFAAVEENDSVEMAEAYFAKAVLESIDDEQNLEDPFVEDPGFDEDGDFDIELITKEIVDAIFVPTDMSEKITAFATSLADRVYSLVQVQQKIDEAQTVDEYLSFSIEVQKTVLEELKTYNGEVKKLTTQEQLDYVDFLTENLYEIIMSFTFTDEPDVPVDDDYTDIDDDEIDYDDDYDDGDYDDYDDPMTPEELKKEIHDGLYEVLFVMPVTEYDDMVEQINYQIDLYTHFQNLDGFAESAEAFYNICRSLSDLYFETAPGYITFAEDEFWEQNEDASWAYLYFDDEYVPSPADYVNNYYYNVCDNVFSLGLFVDINYFRSENQCGNLVEIRDNLAKISDAVKEDIDEMLTVANFEQFSTDVVDYLEAYSVQGVTPLVYGDVTGDAKVTANDVLLIRKSIAGQEIDIDPFAADVNVDGYATANDVLLIRKFVAGQNIVFGPEQYIDEPDYID